MMRTRNKMAKTVWAPLLVLTCIFLYALSSPMNYSQTGFLFFYPLYSDYTIQCLYTTGTWMWIFLISWTLHAVANKKFNETAYKLLAGSSLYAYLSHYFFIIAIAVLVIRPYKMTFVPALITEIILTNLCILITYLIFSFLYDLVVPKKKKPQGTELGTDHADQVPLLKDQEVTVEAKAGIERN